MYYGFYNKNIQNWVTFLYFSIYSIENSTVSALATYKTGESPFGNFPGTKTSYLAAFGEVGVDFDFGQPELDIGEKKLLFIFWEDIEAFTV